MVNILLVGFGGFIGSALRYLAPIIVEIADTKEKLEAFLDLIDPHIKAGIVTLEKVQIKFYCASQT